MTEPAFDAESHVRAMTASLGLTVEPAWMPEVVAHLAAIRAAAQLVERFALADEAEPAPIFEAGR
ncbi:DUF4089 domain-containing protein [Siculibacillus lacustris]|uniref:DUF4089 domain-containing protein n=1 Tax=Siculibacillus lacustris TaxID=1549641 RepID=A0A4V2KTI3_9HYPH|nr:DUF4089 domain-containing protein [Siculibacillus lacustris]TBW37361.1 DUF4089 domain-containing protein [Siculibacillus lacustris]